MRPVIPENIELTVPGPVPKEPKFYINTCDCEQCIAYRGTYEHDLNTDIPGTPELTQEGE